MADQKLNIQISADASGAVTGLAVVAKGIEGVSQSTKYSFGGAEGAVESFNDKLRDFKSEATQAGRVANFYARDLTEIIPGATGASAAIKGLIAAGVSGGGLAAGFELALVVIKSVNDAIQEQAKEAQKLRDVHIDVAAEINKGLASIQRTLEGATTRVQAFKDAFADSTTSELVKANKEASALLQKSGGIIDFVRYMGSVFVNGPEHATTGIADDIDKAFAPALERAKEYDSKRGQIDQKRAEENLRLARENDAKILQIHAQTADAITRIDLETQAKVKAISLNTKTDDPAMVARDAAQIEAIEKESATRIAHTHAEQRLETMKLQSQLLTGEAKITADYAIKIEAIENNIALDRTTKAARVAAEAQIYVKQVADYRIEQEMRVVKAEGDAAKEIQKLWQAQDAQRAEIGQKRAESDNKELEKRKKALKELEDASKTFGDGLGSAFAGIISGTESVSKAFADMAKSAISAIIDVAVKTVEADAVAAAAEAAKAEAGIPVIGPVLAVGAMSAMGALIKGLLSSIPSSAGGLDQVPYDRLQMVHKDETIMSAPLAQTFRKAAESVSGGGGSGGGVEHHYHFHGTFIDRQSVSRMMQHRGYVEGSADAARLGR